jgi:3-oxoacyl-[acyl-carrier protein] reductase
MGKLALITGGTKGIGFAVAERVLREGFDVVLTYSSDLQAANASAGLLQSKYNGKVTLMQADISDLSSIDTIYNHLMENDLCLDAVVFNAGLTDRTSFGDLDMAVWKNVFDANVHFPVFFMQKCLTRFNAGASVVFTGSLMGIHPHSVSLVYGVTKSTVHALVKNMVKFLSPHNIRVNAVAPGFVDTEWQKTKPAEIKASINSKIALGRFCEPDELTDFYWLLINNSYINGEILVADGGYSYK